jgi:hypothetical protein
MFKGAPISSNAKRFILIIFNKKNLILAQLIENKINKLLVEMAEVPF